MQFLLLAQALGAAPAPMGSVGDASALHRTDVVIPWSQLAFEPARPESPAMGPDLLAVGSGGVTAVFDAADDRVSVTGGAAFAVGRADGLAFDTAGHIVVLDDGAREVRVYSAGGSRLDRMALPGVAPAGGTLLVQGESIVSVDLFGNGHPLAIVARTGMLSPVDGVELLAPTHRVTRNGGTISVDGRAVVTRTGRVGARSLGGWLLVEAMNEGTVTREAFRLANGASVTLPVRGRRYAPTLDVVSAPDDTLAWMDPRDDGLHVVTVTP